MDDDVLGSQGPPLPTSVRTACSLMWTVGVCDAVAGEYISLGLCGGVSIISPRDHCDQA